MKKTTSIYLQFMVLCVAMMLAAYWIVLLPQRTQVAVAEQTAASQQTTFAFIFAAAVILAVVIARRIRIEQLWSIFFVVLACVGILVSFFYSIPQYLPVVVIYAMSILGTVGVIYLRKTHTTVFAHNVVMALACVGVARVFGSQFAPTSMMLVGAVASAYTLLAVFSERHLLSVATMLFEQQIQYGFIVTPHMLEWVTVPADSPKSQRLLSAVDLTLPTAMAISFLIRGFTQFFCITAVATCVGVAIAQAVRTRGLRLPPLPIIVTSCILAVYFSSKYFL